MDNSSHYVLEGQPNCSPIASTLITTTISVVSIFAFVGNILVTAVFLINKTLRTSTNYFLVNMAVGDLLSTACVHMARRCTPLRGCSPIDISSMIQWLQLFVK